MSGLFATLVDAATGRGESVRPPPRPRFAPEDGPELLEDPEVAPGPPEGRAPGARGGSGADGPGAGERERAARVDQLRVPPAPPEPAEAHLPAAAPQAAPPAPAANRPATPRPNRAVATPDPDRATPHESPVRRLPRWDPPAEPPLLPPLHADPRDPPGRHAAHRAVPVRPRREDPSPPASPVPAEIRIERIVVNPPAPVGVPEAAPPPRGPVRAAPRQSLDDYLTSRRR